ncbi:flavin-containing monooxygenase [Xylariaceae sp. FL0804]|nr:flavin-containing monooxygenase [Xylariaceae sp. FL0804]
MVDMVDAADAADMTDMADVIGTEARSSWRSAANVAAGLSGLAALKECLAAGLDAEVLEARAELGGQWAYQDVPDGREPADLQSCMYDGVLLNSCRDTSGFSDFPLDPARYGDYFGHRHMLRYICEYAAHFGLERHVRLRTRVLSCVPNEDGTWTVELRQEGCPAEKRVYGAVFAASGARTQPLMPDFEDRELFGGEVLHSRLYRRPGRFEGKRVAVVGLGSAAVDIASELAPGCSEVHVITRRGGWILPRYVLGKPTEAWDNRATQVWVPLAVSQYLQTTLLNVVQGKHPADLKPEHRIMEQNPTVRSEFLERVRAGAIQTHRACVQRFTETGLRLDDNTTVEVDAVIACTGYEAAMPYLPDDAIRGPATPRCTVDLWKLVVPLRYANLFVLGLTELAGPMPPASEAQARLAVAAVQGRVQLPRGPQLTREVDAWQEWQAATFVRSERHAITDLYVPYVDGLLAPLGADPTLGRLLRQVFTSGRPWRALRTLNAVYFGLTSSAQWRLCGHGRDERLARATVLRIASGGAELSDEERACLAEGPAWRV